MMLSRAEDDVILIAWHNQFIDDEDKSVIFEILGKAGRVFAETVITLPFEINYAHWKDRM
jgi:hypothetical protein